MKEDIKNILEESMHDVIIDAIKDVDIKGIMKKQIELVTEGIARDMFSSYGDFQKELQEKIKKEVSFNIDNLSVPNFGQLAIDSIQAELKKVESDEMVKFEKGVANRIASLFGTNNETLTLDKLQNAFGYAMYQEHLEYEFDGCQFNDLNFESLDELIEEISNRGLNYEFVFTLQERDRNWGSDWDAVTTHIIMEFKKDDKIINAINLHISRESQKGESYRTYSRYNPHSENIYKVIGVEINGKNIMKDGTIILTQLNNEAEQLTSSMLLNSTLLDCTNLFDFEIDND